ncbi:MAG TPA: hypothetical protein VG842_04025 [Sediminibacterium sp.]|nr:hypothetical protein [Sediminibacterium sp.]
MRNKPLLFGSLLAMMLLVWACQKEYSLENGGFNGTATGELVDSLGNCKSVDIHGSYQVDTPLVATSNYVNVNVNFTSQGKYKIYTDTVNGMWFIDSGYALSTGANVVKLKGYGTPILNKTSDFTLIFNNTQCAFSINVGGSAGTGGSGSSGDYFPTTTGSSWVYDYIPKLGSVDTFTVTVAPGQIQYDTLVYSRFATRLQDTFYFAKDGLGTYYALSTVDFDYTLVFDTIPNFYISYPFLKENANVGDSWSSGTYGPVWTGGQRGTAKAVFTIISKNTSPYTIGGKTYQNVINVQRDIMFLPDGGSSYSTLLRGNSYYAKGYGLIDQVFQVTPAQSVSLYQTPVIK